MHLISRLAFLTSRSFLNFSISCEAAKCGACVTGSFNLFYWKRPHTRMVGPNNITALSFTQGDPIQFESSMIQLLSFFLAALRLISFSLCNFPNLDMWCWALCVCAHCTMVSENLIGNSKLLKKSGLGYMRIKSWQHSLFSLSGTLEPGSLQIQQWNEIVVADTKKTPA